MPEIVKPEALEKALEALEAGKLIVYPTETCYGLGADATNPLAVEQIFKVKSRERTKAISIIVSSKEMIKKYAKINKETERLIQRFMPGPLTLIVPKKTSLPSKETIAFRIPANAFALKLVQKFNKPITATSANLSGQKEFYTIKDVIKTFSKLKEIAVIINAGNLPERKPSTIFDMVNKKIRREGDIKEAKIKKVLYPIC